MTWPAIDHGGLSPSGRVSKRARAAWLAREAARLFPPGTFADPKRPETAAEKRVRILRTAAELRALAERGMKPRAYRREAERLEAEAASL